MKTFQELEKRGKRDNNKKRFYIYARDTTYKL